MDIETVKNQVARVAETFGRQRDQRLRRQRLDPADFQALAQAGFLSTAVPVALGGLWESLPGSTRVICDMVRGLARADPSLALVTTMHSAVLVFWAAIDSAPDPYTDAWRRQRDAIARGNLAPTQRGRAAPTVDPRVKQLGQDNARLRRRLARAEAIIEIQKKASELLGIPLSPPDSDASG